MPCAGLELMKNLKQKHFKKTKRIDIDELHSMLCNAANKWAEQNNIADLAQIGSHNFYMAIQDMVEKERYGPYRWDKSADPAYFGDGWMKELHASIVNPDGSVPAISQEPTKYWKNNNGKA